MENLEALLERWQRQDVQDLPLGKLKTDDAYQPRNPHVAPFADRDRLKAEAEKHVARLADLLGNIELDPMLAARIGGTLYVVDGHHRLKAHKRAKRSTAPVRILPMDAATAVMASKLVNCGGGKLPMHDEQARECAWQYLAAITARGTRPLPEGISNRHLGRTFGTSRETIGAMLRQLPNVDVRAYRADALDPGTGWPRWKHLKGNAIRDRFADLPDDERQRKQDERNASKLAAMLEKIGHDAFLRAVALVKDEAIAEALADLADTLPDESALY